MGILNNGWNMTSRLGGGAASKIEEGFRAEQGEYLEMLRQQRR